MEKLVFFQIHGFIISLVLAFVQSEPIAEAYAQDYAHYAGPNEVYVSPLIAATLPVTSHQHHAQDAYGQYEYGYNSANIAKHELKTADGITRGAYSYVDANGVLQTTNYISDDVFGFRVAATNLPQAVAPAPAAVAPAPIAVAPAPEIGEFKELLPEPEPAGINKYTRS